MTPPAFRKDELEYLLKILLNELDDAKHTHSKLIIRYKLKHTPPRNMKELEKRIEKVRKEIHAIQTKNILLLRKIVNSNIRKS